MTPETIFEDLCDRLATARARYLVGERTEARQMLQQARLDYLRHREALRGMAGEMALRHSLESLEGMRIGI